MANDTIFGKILRNEIPSDRVWEDEQCIAFRDITPQAPVHILIIPREHIRSVGHASAAQAALMGHLLWVAARVAEQEGLGERGYRVVSNIGRDGQQSVDHLHIHLLGGRTMGWPPG